MQLRPLCAASIILAGTLLGCAEIQPPGPAEILESPLGKSAVRLGMTKDEVRDLWGEPDQIEALEEGIWGSKRELWIYEARFPELSQVDVGYATRTKRLLFEGDSLISTNP